MSKKYFAPRDVKIVMEGMNKPHDAFGRPISRYDIRTAPSGRKSALRVGQIASEIILPDFKAEY